MTATTPNDRIGQRNNLQSGRSSVLDRGALTGCTISAIAGMGWTQWGASGLSGNISVAILIAGNVVGLTVLARSLQLRSSAQPSRGSMFGSRAYACVVALEVVGLFGGAAILRLMGESPYVPAWYAAVVGAHFLAFGRFFYAKFYWLGGLLIAGGVAGALVGLTGGGPKGIEATSGLIAAASLLAAGAWSVLRSRHLARG